MRCAAHDRGQYRVSFEKGTGLAEERGWIRAEVQSHTGNMGGGHDARRLSSWPAYATAAIAAYFRSGRSGNCCCKRSTSVNPTLVRWSLKTSTGQRYAVMTL